MWDREEDLTVLVAEAIQKLKILNLDIRQQSSVDPALAWIRYRVEEIEALLGPITREAF